MSGDNIAQLCGVDDQWPVRCVGRRPRHKGETRRILSATVKPLHSNCLHMQPTVEHHKTEICMRTLSTGGVART